MFKHTKKIANNRSILTLCSAALCLLVASGASMASTRDYQAGPIWSQADAERKCPALAKKHRLGWNGQWRTTIPGKMSVCGLETLVTVYQHCNYGGYAVNLSPGSYTMAQLKALGIRNDDLSSLRVKKGYVAVVYQHDGYKGKKWDFTQNSSCLVNQQLNDEISSIYIQKL